jgi:DnaJ-domain-containing protein 1
MKATPEQLILQQIQALCQGHAQALRDALQDMALLALTPAQYSQLSKADRRLLDQFAYRYTRLQDDMGTRLMPARFLKALGEDVAPMSAIDRFARLEQLGWLPSADAWATLRQIRNQFTHDDPDDVAERFDRLQAATVAAGQLLSP